MWEDFVITDHVVERYFQRVSESKKDITKRIKKDLNYKKIKRIVNNGDTRHVFTFNSKEFIFKKDRGTWILKTIIKRNRENNSYAIQKRIKNAVAV